MTGLTESMVEEAALGWFQALGYAILPGLQLDSGEPSAERESLSDVALVGRLRLALRQLNPALADDTRKKALRKLLRLAPASLVRTNCAFHLMLREVVPVE
jgi:type I restriction enzyme R subunit